MRNASCRSTLGSPTCHASPGPLVFRDGEAREPLLEALREEFKTFVQSAALELFLGGSSGSERGIDLSGPLLDEVRTLFGARGAMFGQEVARCLGVDDAGALSRRGSGVGARISLRRPLAGGPEPRDHELTLEVRGADFKGVVPDPFRISNKEREFLMNDRGRANQIEFRCGRTSDAVRIRPRRSSASIMLVRGSRWISQRRPVAANGREHSLGVGNEQIGDEHIGMPRRQIVGREALGREVPQVPSHDRVCTGFNRGCQHMDVVRVRQVETSGTCRVSCHNRIGKVPVHCRAGSFQHVHREIGPVRESATHPLRMDIHAPSRRIEVLVGQSQEKIPKAGRIEDVCVEQRRGKGRRLLQAELLIHGSQLVQRLAAIVKDVLGADAAMCAYLPAGDPSFVEQLNQVRSRYLQEIRCLARRELRMQRRQRHTVAVRHVVQDLLEHPHCRGRDIDGFSSRGAETGADRARPVIQCRQFAACFVRK